MTLIVKKQRTCKKYNLFPHKILRWLYKLYSLLLVLPPLLLLLLLHRIRNYTVSFVVFQLKPNRVLPFFPMIPFQHGHCIFSIVNYFNSIVVAKRAFVRVASNYYMWSTYYRFTTGLPQAYYRFTTAYYKHLLNVFIANFSHEGFENFNFRNNF